MHRFIVLAIFIVLSLKIESSQAQDIVAHRGASFDAPENTLAAFQLAWEQNADAIEGDFYLTADGEIVCIHDKDTARTSPGSPVLSVSRSTVAELKKLDVGSWKNAEFAGEQIPTLEEVLELIPPGKKILVEIKCGPEIVPVLNQQLKRSGLNDEQILIICFNQDVVKAVRRAMPQYKVNWLTGYKQRSGKTEWTPDLGQVIETLRGTGATGLGTQGKLPLIDEAYAKRVSEAGFELHVWTVNNPAEARRFSELSFDSITTDKPALIKQAIHRGDADLKVNISDAEASIDFRLETEVVRSGYDGKTCWVHARAGVVPVDSGLGSQRIVMTSQRLNVTGSDTFTALSSSFSDDQGVTWSELLPQNGFARWQIGDSIEETICDFVPLWHKESGCLLGTGQSVRYQDGHVMKVRPRYTAYSVYDAKQDSWSTPKKLVMPHQLRFENCGAGSVQRYDLQDGKVLLPVYFKVPTASDYGVTVCLCSFDGEELKYLEHGTELTVPGGRGLYEPSVTKVGERFFLTLRNDQAGYVCSSQDGLHYSEPVPWLFDDGEDLGNYNTQQHWVQHKSDLYLVYTRRGAGNDHVFRHRAPLFIAKVDQRNLRVIRSTERILVPERGARLGNFGVVDISSTETWVVVTEWMQTWKKPSVIIPVDNEQGADNSIYVAKIQWKN